MIIERLSNTAVKISIDDIEMMRYGVDFETLSENSHETRYMITELLKNINYNTGVNLLSSKLFIEAFSIKENNSCILYISVINDSDDEIFEPYIYYVFDFENIENCIGFINHISDEAKESIKHSSLYLAENIFRLSAEIFCDYEDCILSSVMEFGDISGYGELYMLHIDEQYKCIIKDEAISQLMELTFK